MSESLIPEAALIQNEFIIRDMQLSKEVKMTKKSLIRWLALSMGLISPNESRRTMLALLEALFFFQFSEETDPDIHEITTYIKDELKQENANEKAIRYHISQLKKAGIIDRVKGKYRFSISPLSEKGDVAGAFEYNYKNRVDVAFSKIQEALRILKKMHK
jgi:DNA-binding transcriptional ArsR family regulator